MQYDLGNHQADWRRAGVGYLLLALIWGGMFAVDFAGTAFANPEPTVAGSWLECADRV